MESENRLVKRVKSTACDLLRCTLEHQVLSVAAKATIFTSYKELAEKKLYGKLNNKIRHLYCTQSDGQTKYIMLEWELDDIATYEVKALINGEKFERIALMNEIFAQELKEEVLRKLGRVGTQIDPPPPISLKSKLRWKVGEDIKEIDSPVDRFVPALLTYVETPSPDSKKTQAVILSDAFRDWAVKEISDSFSDGNIPPKIKASIEQISTTPRFVLKQDKFIFQTDSMKIKVLKEDELDALDSLVEVALILPEMGAD